jgi:GTP-dependent phosphoenolpyruvate carboxykinase
MVWNRRSMIKPLKGKNFANILSDGRDEIHYKDKISDLMVKTAAEKNKLKTVKRKNAIIFNENGTEIARLVDKNLLIIKKEANKKISLNLASDLKG